MSSRETILGRIRSALTDVPAGERPSDVAVPRSYRRALPSDVDLVSLLLDRLVDYKATVHRCGAADLPDVIHGTLVKHGIHSLVTPAGIPDSWLGSAESTRLVEPLSVAQLDAADGVITGSALAIAETGTIVLDGGPGQGRRALSLLPDYHLCVVAADQIVGTVPEAMSLLDPSRALTWISGPSATSDIELIRVEGVHGPRLLDVVILE